MWKDNLLIVYLNNIANYFYINNFLVCFLGRGSQLEAKVNVTIVCLLSLIAYNFIIDEDLPKLAYLTFLDVFILLSCFTPV